MSTTQERVIAIANEHLKPEKEIYASSKFAEDLGADSLDVVDLVMAIEEEFGIVISDDEIAKLVTVQDAIDHVEQKAEKAA